MRSLTCAALTVSLVACVTEVETGTDTSSVTIHNRIAANRIAANRIAANRIAANRIAANRIAANRLELSSNADDMIETADGREVLTYIVSCALPEGTTLVGTDSHGTSYEFNGEIGLASSWIDHALSSAGKGWISACLFARVNDHDVAVDVSLRGPSSALDTTPSERAAWSLEEGAFYGQYFLPIDEPIAWFACSGRDDAEAVIAQQRECAAPDPAHPGLTLCGFNYAGPCRGAIPPLKNACRSQSSGTYFEDCADHPMFSTGHHGDDGHGHGHGHAWGWHDDHDDHGDHDHGHDCHHGDGHGHHGDDDVFEQVITTFVQP